MIEALDLLETPAQFTTGNARPVYLWAGQATIDLQHIKFPDIPVDEAAHLQALEPAGAQCLASTGANLAFLSMNWGFPPEIEQYHWREFERAVHTYRSAGIAVIGYVQASNCVSKGSYAQADWYARTRRGRRVPYYHQRFMTCWNEPAWIAEVEARARRVVDAGALGVFFDNVWMGATPWTLGRAVGGFAGCACARCVRAFRQDIGLAIPDFIDDDEASERYLRWRADIVQQRFAGWRAAVRQQSARALVLANNCDVILRDTIGLFGLDLPALAGLQDALLVENVAMPRYHERRARLVANAMALKAVRAAAPGKPVLAVTYEHGIGIDGLPSARRLRRAFSEAAAAGALPTLKGSEYLDERGYFSVVTAPAFAELRSALAPLLRWLQQHAWLYTDVLPAPAVLVPLQPRATGAAWLANAQSFAAAMALLRAQIPFEFTTGHQVTDLPTLRLDARPFAESGVPRVLDLPIIRHLADPLMRRLAGAYFGTVRGRRWLDRSGLTRRFLESPWFRLPANWSMARELVAPLEGPTASSAAPMLVERWRHSNGRYRLHVVNYTDQPVDVVLRAGGPITLHSPDIDTHWLDSSHQRLHLEGYAIIECD